MTDLDQMLQADARRWRADARPVLDFDDQLGAALDRRSDRPHRGRLAAPAIAAAVVVAIAAVLLIARLSGHHSSPPAATADHRLTIQIRLDQTTVRAGTTITGTATITNTARHPLEITTCHHVWLQVGLESTTIPYKPGWLTCRDVPPTRLHVGTTRVPITIRTTYTQCMPHAKSVTAQMPACTQNASGASETPPLPPGDYLTKAAMLTPPGVQIPAPTPIHVTLSP
jgi:hypothetical protein